MASFEEIVSKEKPVLVDFFATWCGPCKMMEPMLKELKGRLGDKVSIIKIDIDRNQELATKLNIRSVPTMLLYKNGDLKWKESGLRQIHELESLIKQYV